MSDEGSYTAHALREGWARLDELGQASAGRPFDAGLREDWMAAAFELIQRYCNEIFEDEYSAAAEELVAAMGQLSKEHAEEPALREQWAGALIRVVGEYSFGDDLDAATKLMKTLEGVRDAYPDEPILREIWARTVQEILTHYNVAEEVSDVVAWMAALETLCDAYPGEHALREFWSLAACNTIMECVLMWQFTSVDSRGDGTGVGRSDGGASGWVDALKVFAAKYPHDAELQEAAAHMEEFRHSNYGDIQGTS